MNPVTTKNMVETAREFNSDLRNGKLLVWIDIDGGAALIYRREDGFETVIQTTDCDGFIYIAP